MKRFDVFNGDADGLCALHQLRLAAPADAVLVTGVKRDIALLSRVDAHAGDEVTVLDISAEANHGALLALYTDGLVEAQDNSGADYSTRRLHELVRTNSHLPANEILQRCLDDYGQFRRVDADDITLIVLRRRAA